MIISASLVKKTVFFIVALLLMLLAFIFEFPVVKAIFNFPLRLAAISLISWFSFKYFLIGILFSIPFVTLSYIFSIILAFLVILETKIKLSKIVHVKKSFNLSWFSYLKFGYLLYGFIPMLVRIFSVFPANKDIITLYTAIVFLVIIYIPYIIPLMAAVILPFALIMERSRIRRLKSNLCLGYPSIIIDALFLLLIGVGSITALAPMYFELLSISGDPWFSFELFMYIILLGYCPSLTFVFGIHVGLLVLGRKTIERFIGVFENIIRKYANPSEIHIKSEFL